MLNKAFKIIYHLFVSLPLMVAITCGVIALYVGVFIAINSNDIDSLPIIFAASALFLTLLVAFAITDGFDFGVGSILPFVAKTDTQRRVVINTVAPVWESNQTWFVLFGGSMFAVYPKMYSILFSTLYIPFLLLLFCFIIRPVAFEFRSKMGAKWSAVWDYCLFASGAIASILFGVAVANCIIGLDYQIGDFGIIHNNVGFFVLLSPFAVLCGVMVLLMFAMHGASYLTTKTQGIIHQRSTIIVQILSLVMPILMLVNVNIYPTTSSFLSLLSPHHNAIIIKSLTAVAIFYYLFTFFAAHFKYGIYTFISSSIALTLTILCAAFTLGTNLIVSKNIGSSVTIFDTSSIFTVKIVIAVVAVFIPILASYIGYSYYKFRHKITENDVLTNHKIFY